MPQTLASVPQSRSPQQDKCRKRPLSGILSQFNNNNNNSSRISITNSQDHHHHQQLTTSSSSPNFEPVKRSRIVLSEADEKIKPNANLKKYASNHNDSSNVVSSHVNGQAELAPKPIMTVSKDHVKGEQNNNNNIQHSSTSSSKPMSSTTKKIKRFSPFRIKVGCTVAVRYRSSSSIIKCVGQSSSHPSYSMLYDRKMLPYFDEWTDPLPDRDLGIALVGRRIRCIFPKFVLKQDMCADKSKPSTCRVLEGEIISIVDNNSFTQTDNDDDDDDDDNDKSRLIGVMLLVDKGAIENMKFVKIIDDFSDATKDNISESEKKRRKYECIIRGKDKVLVHVTLGHDTYISSKKDNEEKTCIKEDGKPEKRPIVAEKWIIKKRIFLEGNKISGSCNGSTNACCIGDKNDSLSQQQKNWRWLAGKHERLKNVVSRENIDGIMFGEVLKVDAGASTNFGISKQPSIQTLAMVTLKKLFLPEHTLSGRLPHHRDWEVFDEICSSKKTKNLDLKGQLDKTICEKENAEIEICTYQVPVEDLVVVSKKVQTVVMKESGLDHIPKNEDGSIESLYIPESYCYENDLFVLNANEINSTNNESNTGNAIPSNTEEVCHRCKRLMPISQLKQCTNEGCHGDKSTAALQASSSHNSTKETSKKKKNWWCGSCCRHFRSIGLFGIYQHCNWCGPCCMGICDCDECIARKRQGDVIDCIIERKFRHGISNDESTPVTDHSLQDMQRCVTCLKQSAKGLINCDICLKPMHKECMDWELKLAQSLRPKSVSNFEKKSEESQTAHELVKSKKKKNKKKKQKKRKNLKSKSRACFNCIMRKLDVKVSPDGENKFELKQSSNNLLDHVAGHVQDTGPLDFELPVDFLTINHGNYGHSISTKDATNSSINKIGDLSLKIKKVRSKPGTKKTPQTAKKDTKSATTKEKTSDKTADDEYLQFQPTCFRTIPYEESKKIPKCFNDASSFAARTIELLRTAGRQNFRASDKSSGKVEKSTSSRAARANQRRMLKDIASFGQQRRIVDSLSGREQSLRFGKSLIHGWGVFTDVQICSGDMIIEYRGILIGNAVADRREKEYEKAKIGSDYMFRIDSEIVCDATHNGNLARFINASCTPNCYTQIITVNSAKRIVIYAKRDINPGEELSYDYKFDAEFDESKRIPCNCRTPDCRGFLNWNKRYVALK